MFEFNSPEAHYRFGPVLRPIYDDNETPVGDGYSSIYHLSIRMHEQMRHIWQFNDNGFVDPRSIIHGIYNLRSHRSILEQRGYGNAFDSNAIVSGTVYYDGNVVVSFTFCLNGGLIKWNPNERSAIKFSRPAF